MGELKLGVIGCGFWSQFQIAGWKELAGIKVQAVCDKDLTKARRTAEKFNIPSYYSEAETMIESESLDVIDIITNVETHAGLVELGVKNKLAIICQKPMAPTLQVGRRMVDHCTSNEIPFFIHENFRWQPQIRRVKEIIDAGKIGRPFKAKVSFCSSFPVFDNQPALAELEQFILTDVGTHILDICRFLFGEAVDLYCKIKTVNPDIRGEDVANVFMEMESGIHCFAEMSYASIMEKESFPQTLILIEGESGSISLKADCKISVATKSGVFTETVVPKYYSWADPAYAIVHGSIVDTNADILKGLKSESHATETTAEDNLKTLTLVFACYESAKSGSPVKIKDFQHAVKT